MTPTDTIAIIIGAAGFVTYAIRSRDKRQAALSASALSLVVPLQERIAVLESDQTKLWRRVADLEAENARLWQWGRLNFTRVLELGGEPSPMDFHGLRP